MSNHLSKYGFHPISLSLINSTPAQETVAGVAYLRFEFSKNNLIADVSGKKSLETKVRTLLSSMNVLRDSIHSGSMSPSKWTIYFSSLYLPKSLH
jgi:hypothetical protein